MNWREKLGPFNILQWAVMLAAFLLAWFYFKRGNGTTIVDNPTDPTVPAVDGVGTLPTSDNTGDTGPTTNLQWEIQAVKWASGNGYTALTSQIALSKYLNGSALTVTESKLIDDVIGHFGLPPNGVSETPVVTPDPSTDTALTTAIRNAYNTFLGRSPSQGEIDYWVNQGIIPPTVNSLIVGSPEAANRRAMLDITAYYNRYLKRLPDAGEISHWTALYNSNGAGWVESTIANSAEAVSKR